VALLFFGTLALAVSAACCSCCNQADKAYGKAASAGMRGRHDGRLVQPTEQRGDHVLAVEAHRAGARSLELNSLAPIHHPDRLAVQLAATATHFAVNIGGVAGKRTDLAAFGIVVSTPIGAAVKILEDVVQGEIHEQGAWQ
jgi:hypothetical protein